MYQLLRSILFRFSPEAVHHFSMHALRLLCSTWAGKKLLSAFFSKQDPRLHTDFLGLPFRNPVGLAAGFDKNAEYLRELECLGFGFVETGTVTPKAQPGNDKPRVFRLPADQALINRMGFNNEGVEVVAERLRKWKSSSAKATEDKSKAGSDYRMIIGGNIGKNKVTPNEDAWKDYEICFNALHDYVDYFVVNVSSPNTPGLRELQEKESLRKILVHLQQLNTAKAVQRPILLKIAPDLTNEQLDDVAALALEIKLDGLVATNTTISREGLSPQSAETSKQAGGLSGKPVQQRSTEVLKYLISRTEGKIPVIASGGIFTGSDAREKLYCGAPLVQVWTGFIYVGPAIVKKITKQLLS
jgi:dihydroorotate dehydrogenase